MFGSTDLERAFSNLKRKRRYSKCYLRFIKNNNVTLQKQERQLNVGSIKPCKGKPENSLKR